MERAIWKYIPRSIGVFDRKSGAYYANVPVTTVILHPPTSERTHPGTAIRGDWHLAEIITTKGTRTYGFADGYITSRLKFAVKLGPGQERDEVIAKWKDAPPRETQSHATKKVPEQKLIDALKRGPYFARVSFSDRAKRFGPGMRSDLPRWTAFVQGLLGHDVSGEGVTKEAAVRAAVADLPASLRRHFEGL